MDEQRTEGRAGKALWRSRRGMLEVENELLPFVREHLDGLEAADRGAYARLLKEDDWTIHDWLRGVSQPADAALRRIVALIRQARSDDGARGRLALKRGRLRRLEWLLHVGVALAGGWVWFGNAGAALLGLWVWGLAAAAHRAGQDSRPAAADQAVPFRGLGILGMAMVSASIATSWTKDDYARLRRETESFGRTVPARTKPSSET